METLGDYVLEAVVGRGAMGAVYRARHVPTGAIRAVKVIPVAPTDKELVPRFRREAEALARVAGAGIVPVHEVGCERGRLFLAMGFMPGGSLRDRVKQGALEWREATRLAVEVARALERCHAAGILHRDVKPDNVLFDEEGRPRLADFGLVRDLESQTLTRTGTWLGTPAYMPPEQFTGQTKKIDGRADEYALAAMLHELVSGTVPHMASSAVEMGARKKRGDRAPLPDTIPRALDAVIARALLPDPDRRFSTLAAFRRELEAVLAGKEKEPPRPPIVGVVLAALLALAIVIAVAVTLLPREAIAPPEPGPASSPSPAARPSPIASAGPKGEAALEAALRELASGTIEEAEHQVDLALAETPALKLPGKRASAVVSACREKLASSFAAVDRSFLKEADAPFKDAFGALRIARKLERPIEHSRDFVEVARDWARHFRGGRDSAWCLAAIEAFQMAAHELEAHYATDLSVGACALIRTHPELRETALAAQKDAEDILAHANFHQGGTAQLLEARVDLLASTDRWDEALALMLDAAQQAGSDGILHEAAKAVIRAGWSPRTNVHEESIDALIAVAPAFRELRMLRPLHHLGAERPGDLDDLETVARSDGSDAMTRHQAQVQLVAAFDRLERELAERCVRWYAGPGASALKGADGADARRDARALIHLSRGDEAARVLDAAGLASLAGRARAIRSDSDRDALLEALR